MAVQYEYKTIDLGEKYGALNGLEKKLNEMSEDGWEYVTDVHQNSGSGATSEQKLIFRRQKLGVLNTSRSCAHRERDPELTWEEVLSMTH